MTMRDIEYGDFHEQGMRTKEDIRLEKTLDRFGYPVEFYSKKAVEAVRLYLSTARRESNVTNERL